MRKVIPIFTGLVILGIALIIIGSLIHHPNDAGRQPPSATPSGSSPSGDGQPSTAGSSGENDSGNTEDPTGPVAAAKADTEALETALFLPRSEANAVVAAVVLPSQAETQKLSLKFKGPIMATDELRYRSWNDARRHARYSYQVQKFRIDKQNRQAAQITLFGVMSWYSPPDSLGQQDAFCWPDLRVVYMKYARVRVNGKNHKRWLLAAQGQPSAGELPPPPKRGASVSCEQAVEKFQTKTKDFRGV